MEDKKVIEVLTRMLTKYPFTAEESEAVRDSIGVMGWTKLVEGWKEQKKRKRDRQMSENDTIDL